MYTCPPLPYPLVHKGKVREIFDLGDDLGGRLLMVATDRLSAFDVVFPDPVPGKGKVLTQLSILWFGATRHIIPNHFRSADVWGLGLGLAAQELEGRSMIVARARRIDVECVVRGFLAGSAWKEYQATGSVTGIRLPAGLKLNSRLPDPIFTPAIKNDQGHDENVSFGRVADMVGLELAHRLRLASLALYNYGRARAEEAGILLADSKFEFGFVDGELTLIDEVFTPDSSRFWPADRYQEGEPIDSLDKQPVRDYVESIGWHKQPPAPALPQAVLLDLSRRYQEALMRLARAVNPADLRYQPRE